MNFGKTIVEDLSDIEVPQGYLRSPAHGQRLLSIGDRLPLLICGVAGVAGFNGFHHFRRKYGHVVMGQRAANNWPLSADGIVGCDLEDYDAVARLIDHVKPRAIWNCGGSCALKSCERDPAMAQRVNVDGVQNLLQCMKGRDIRFVHCSIDLVFSGIGGGNYRESDPVDPVTVYGKTMVEAEQRITEQMPSACILRISLPMGVSFNGHAGAIDWIQARFAKNKPATLYFDEIRTPTYVECLNEVAEEILAGDLAGVFHAGGPRGLSLYQIAQIVNRIGGYHPDNLLGCPRIDAGPMPPRAGNVTMNSEKLSNALGRLPFCPWPLTPNFIPTNREWHYRRQEPGSPELLAACLYDRPLSNGYRR